MELIKMEGQKYHESEWRNYLHGIFLCPKCGAKVSRILWHGKRQKGCSPRCSSKSQNGITNPNWKGGKTTDNGYLVVRREGHHRANKNGYVYEHIAVAEEAFGRLLKDNEVVHHINGIKTDNRPENLRIMSRGKHLNMHLRMGAKVIATICLVVFLSGCANKTISSITPQTEHLTHQATISPMLRTVMWSTLFSDVADPEWRLKMRALHDMNIRGASGLFMICRPQFCEYPWVAVSGQQGSSDATYDLMRINQRWLSHVSEVVDYANSFEPPFALQFDYLPHPTLRHKEYMVFKGLRALLAPLSLMDQELVTGHEGERDEMVFSAKGNVQGVRATSPALFNHAPSGAWAEVSRNLIRQTVPIINRARSGAVLFVLEGSGSRDCEQWYWNEARTAGLSPHIYVITNEALPGATKSPHLHSVSAFRKYRGPYASSDGWEPNAREWRQCVDAQALNGAVAIELYRTEFSDGSGGKHYYKRTRPSAA